MPNDNPTPTENDAPAPQTSDQEILEKILKGEEYRETFVFETKHGDLEIDLTPIGDREKRYEYLSKLPSGWFEAGQKDDPEAVDNFASLIPDGDGITALENIVIESAQHPAFTQSDMELIVRKRMADEVVTQAALQVIQMSSESNTDVTGFRKRE